MMRELMMNGWGNAKIFYSVQMMASKNIYDEGTDDEWLRKC